MLIVLSVLIWFVLNCWQSSYILRRPQNFAKSPPYFCLQYIQTKVRWRFCKILWPSQNIWTLTINSSRLIAKTREYVLIDEYCIYTPILTLLIMILKLHSQTPRPFLYDFVLNQWIIFEMFGIKSLSCF